MAIITVDVLDRDSKAGTTTTAVKTPIKIACTHCMCVSECVCDTHAQRMMS